MENEIFEGFCISKENENFIYKGEFESNLKNGFGMIYKNDILFIEGLFSNN